MPTTLEGKLKSNLLNSTKREKNNKKQKKNTTLCHILLVWKGWVNTNVNLAVFALASTVRKKTNLLQFFKDQMKSVCNSFKQTYGGAFFKPEA